MGEENAKNNPKNAEKTTKKPLSNTEKSSILIQNRKNSNNLLIKKVSNFLNSKIKKVNLIHKKNTSLIKDQKTVIEKINKKYNEIKNKTKNIFLGMKNNPTFSRISKIYKKSKENIDEKIKEILFLNKKVEELN